MNATISSEVDSMGVEYVLIPPTCSVLLPPVLNASKKLGNRQRANPCPIVQTLVSTLVGRWPKDVSVTKVV